MLSTIRLQLTKKELGLKPRATSIEHSALGIKTLQRRKGAVIARSRSVSAHYSVTTYVHSMCIRVCALARSAWIRIINKLTSCNGFKIELEIIFSVIFLNNLSFRTLSPYQNNFRELFKLHLNSYRPNQGCRLYHSWFKYFQQLTITFHLKRVCSCITYLSHKSIKLH